MATPEQLKSKRYDNEVRKLRKENEVLQKTLSEMRGSIAEIIRALAVYAPSQYRARLLHQARDIEDAT